MTREASTEQVACLKTRNFPTVLEAEVQRSVSTQILKRVLSWLIEGKVLLDLHVTDMSELFCVSCMKPKEPGTLSVPSFQ